MFIGFDTLNKVYFFFFCTCTCVKNNMKPIIGTVSPHQSTLLYWIIEYNGIWTSGAWINMINHMKAARQLYKALVAMINQGDNQKETSRHNKKPKKTATYGQQIFSCEFWSLPC